MDYWYSKIVLLYIDFVHILRVYIIVSDSSTNGIETESKEEVINYDPNLFHLIVNKFSVHLEFI